MFIRKEFFMKKIMRNVGTGLFALTLPVSIPLAIILLMDFVRRAENAGGVDNLLGIKES
jgi:hypothetical protein